MIDINGLTNETDVLTSIKENIQDGNTDTAIDLINQLIEYHEEKYRDDKHQGRLDENGMSIGRGRLW
jgi:hypothetical protein